MQPLNVDPTSTREIAGVPPTVWLSTLLTFVLLMVSPRIDSEPLDIQTFVSLVVLFIASLLLNRHNFAMAYGRRRFRVSMSSTIFYVMACVHSPFVAIVFSILSMAVWAAASSLPLQKALCNISSHAISTFIAGFLFFALWGNRPRELVTTQEILVLLLASALAAVAHSFIFAICASQIEGTYLFSFWHQNRLLIGVEWIIAPMLSGLLLIVAKTSSFGVLLYFVPLAMAVIAFKSMQSTQERTERALESIASMLEFRERRTANHASRVAENVERMLHQLPDANIAQGTEILHAAHLHDLGKIAVSDSTLLKPGPLSPEEIAEMRQHVTIGAELVKRFNDSPVIMEGILHHHERWDGKGYPDGLAGEQIPLASRLIAIADSYDAMCNDRPYRKAVSPDVAIAEIRRQAGTQFDPSLVDLFVSVMEKGPAHGDPSA